MWLYRTRATHRPVKQNTVLISYWSHLQTNQPINQWRAHFLLARSTDPWSTIIVLISYNCHSQTNKTWSSYTRATHILIKHNYRAHLLQAPLADWSTSDQAKLEERSVSESSKHCNTGSSNLSKKCRDFGLASPCARTDGLSNKWTRRVHSRFSEKKPMGRWGYLAYMPVIER